MDWAVLTPLFQNIALLLVLSVVFEAFYLFPIRFRRLQPVLVGALIALICVATMAAPYVLQPGVMFDARSIIISVTALIFGLIPTLIASAAAVVFRIIEGGIGTLAGIAIIVSSAVIGLVWRRWLYPNTKLRRWPNIILMEITVHVAVVACMLLLPYPANLDTVRTLALPVLIGYPAAGTLLCLLLMRQQRTQQLRDGLRQSEERFRALFQQAPLGYQSLDVQGNIITVNQQWLDTMGYEREEVIGKWFGDFLTPAYQDVFRERFPLFRERGQIHSELELVHKSGRVMTISFEGKISYGLTGEFKQTHCILQDISDQRKAQESLQESEEQYRRLYETMSQGVVYQAASGEIISANPAAERVLGLTLDEMRGATSMDPRWKAIREDGSEMTGEEHPAMVALRTGKPFGPFIMGVFQPKINEHVWLSVTATPLFRPGEVKPYQVYALFQDITAEREAQQKYKRLFNEMIDGFALHEIICDPQGKPVDYRFLAVNPAFEQSTGLEAKDIVGKTMLEIFPQVEAYWIDIYGKVALTGEPAQFENYSSLAGKHFMVSAYQTEPMRFACTFTDITQRVKAEKEAIENNLRLQGLLDNSPGPIMIVNRQGRCVNVSNSFADILSTPKDTLRGQDIRDILPPEMAERYLQALQSRAGGGDVLVNLDTVTLGSEKRYLESRFFAIPITDQQEKLYGYIGVDVTERVLAEQALQESEKRYSSYIQSAPDGIAVLDEKGTAVEVNDAMIWMLGYAQDDFPDCRYTDWVDPAYLDVSVRMFNDLRQLGAVNGDVMYKHRDGTSRWARISAVKLSDTRYLCFVSDITENRLAADKLLYAANHDRMTDLWNRKYFDTELERMDVAAQWPLSIVVGDINGLKLINDSFGRTEGDRIITETAGFLAGYCRPGDVLARTGGDEFSILLPQTSEKSAAALVMKIQEGCAQYNKSIADDSLHMNIALGAATKKSEEQPIGDVVKQAEANMAQSKLLEIRSSHSNIIATIRAAMKEKSHETEAHEERMARLARKVGRIMGLPQRELDYIQLLAELHDIGKIGISEHILNKPGKLTEAEWVEMKQHPEIGERIALSTASLAPIANYILCHHERWDGTGYPQQLAQDEIPLLSRILAVVDAYDAMTQDRVYQKAMSHENALQEIRKNAGTQFDPEVARVFCDEVFAAER